MIYLPRMFKFFTTGLSMVFFLLSILRSPSLAQSPLPHPSLDESLTKDALHAIRIGVAWLEAHQQEDGCWSNPGFPAMTGLAVSAILNSPDAIASAEMPESASRGLNLILNSVQPDGCIYTPIEGIKGGGMPNYNTAICLMALADGNRPEYASVIASARKCLIDLQYLGEGEFSGGMGYDASTDRPYADLSNTVMALEALRRTQPGETAGKGVETPDLDWEAAIQFVSRCQHLKETNASSWVRETTEEKGGFVYHPSESKAGAVESIDGEEGYLRSYGSMTYAGLLSLLYAQVDRDDPRVRAAVDWISRRWTVEENPGMGMQGLYYNYHTMAKALNAFGQETLVLPGGRKVEWRRALVEKIVSLQRIDPQTGYGYWQNESNRWWENDPNLVTAYTLLALEISIYGRSPGVPGAETRLR